MSIDYPSKYSSQTNVYIKFRYFGIYYSHLYVTYYFFLILDFEKFEVCINFKILK